MTKVRTFENSEMYSEINHKLYFSEMYNLSSKSSSFSLYYVPARKTLSSNKWHTSARIIVNILNEMLCFYHKGTCIYSNFATVRWILGVFYTKKKKKTLYTEDWSGIKKDHHIVWLAKSVRCHKSCLICSISEEWSEWFC